MGKDGQLGQRGWIRRRGGRVIRVLHLRVSISGCWARA